jgi:hypothetical protein
MSAKLVQDIFVKKRTVQPLEPEKPPRPEKDRREKDREEIKEWDDFFREKRFLWLRTKKKKIIFGFAAAIFLSVGYLTVNFLSSVYIEITPRQEIVDINTVLRAAVEPKNGELPLEAMQISRAEKGVGRATARKEVSQKASGKIVIYNAYSSAPQPLIQNTRFEAATNGKIYRIDKSIVVPGAKIEEGKIIPSEIEVTLYADKPGEDYNTGLADFAIPGFKGTPKYEKFYGRSRTEISGGFTGEASVITESDINDLQASLKEKIKEYLLKTAKIQQPKNFLLYENAKQIIFEENKKLPKAGDIAEEFEIEEKATFFGFLLRPSDIGGILAEKYLKSEDALRAEVVNIGNLSFELKDFTAENITFNLKGKAHFAWKVDEEALKHDLTDRSKNPEEIFKNYPAIEKAKVIFRPSWWRFFPKNPSKIHIGNVLTTDILHF